MKNKIVMSAAFIVLLFAAASCDPKPKTADTPPVDSLTTKSVVPKDSLTTTPADSLAK